jgi:hypothetical protein
MGLPFRAIENATLAATTSSGSVALPGGARAAGQDWHMRLQNTGPSEAFFNLGGAAVAAVAGGAVTASPDGSVALAVGAIEIWRIDPGVTHIAAITAAGTAVLRISIGEGL